METRFLDVDTKKIIICLNRTMQYGNIMTLSKYTEPVPV